MLAAISTSKDERVVMVVSNEFSSLVALKKQVSILSHPHCPEANWLSLSQS